MDYKRVLILHYTNGMSSREIDEATGYGKTTVNVFLKRFREYGELSYPPVGRGQQRIHSRLSVQESRQSCQF